MEGREGEGEMEGRERESYNLKDKRMYIYVIIFLFLPLSLSLSSPCAAGSRREGTHPNVREPLGCLLILYRHSSHRV